MVRYGKIKIRPNLSNEFLEKIAVFNKFDKNNQKKNIIRNIINLWNKYQNIYKSF